MVAAQMESGVTYQLNLCKEGVDFLPSREDALLLLRKVDRHGWRG
jgi:hypothetical protein